MRILKLALFYFFLVFSVGFLLGVIRTLWLVPIVGVRIAELLEMPLMFIATLIAARHILASMTTLHAAPPTARNLLTTGLLALLFMLAAEFGFVLRLRGITLADYFDTLDPVTAPVFYAMQLLFAAMPYLLWKRRPTHESMRT